MAVDYEETSLLNRISANLDELVLQASLTSQDLEEIVSDHRGVELNRQLGKIETGLEKARKNLDRAIDAIAEKAAQIQREQDKVKADGERLAGKLAEAEKELQELKKKPESKSPKPNSRPTVHFADNKASSANNTASSTDKTVSSPDNTAFTVSGAASKANDRALKANFSSGEGADHHDTKPRKAVQPDHATDIYLADAAMSEGRIAFDAQKYDEAADCFANALKQIERLPLTEQQRFDIYDVKYCHASSIAYSPSLDSAAKEGILAAFVELPTVNYPHQVRLAEVQHLLAKTYIAQGQLEKAQDQGKAAFGFRLGLGEEDMSCFESAALLVRIYELQGDQSGVRVLLSRFPPSYREGLKVEFSHLSLGKASARTDSIKTPAKPAAQPKVNKNTRPATTKKDSSHRSINPEDSRPQIRDPVPKSISKSTRRRWLNRLDLHTSHPSLEDAIIDSDILEVSELIVKGFSPKHALHIAALFGEVEIAQSLFLYGREVGEICYTTSEKPNEFCFFVTPLHLAIGARQYSMIRFLRQEGASLGIPSVAENSRRNSFAPPHWLLSQRWLELTQTTNAVEVLETIDVLLAVSWNINAPLNSRGETIMDMACDLTENFHGLKAAVINHLQRLGGKQREQLSSV